MPLFTSRRMWCGSIIESAASLRSSWLLFLLLVAYVCGAMSQTPSETSLPVGVLVGYQGWFRCPGDGSITNSWSHWSAKGEPSAETIAVDLYPDTSELSSRSLCQLPEETIDGRPTYLFSSYFKETVDKHFEWMQNYGIDGALLQRFTQSISGQKEEGDTVLKNVRDAAEAHHRVFAIEYDVSGAPAETVLQELTDDWTYLSRDIRITSSSAYLSMNGKPLVAVWGLGFNDGHHIDDPKLALEIIHWFKRHAHVTVMGGVPADWGTLSADSVSKRAWRKVYAALDIVQPWTVGRYGSIDAVDRWKTTHLIPDLELTEKNHQLYMPVIFPGFSWHNLYRKEPKNQIPRLGGSFLWRQAYNARTAGAPFLKIAMFDEVNEGTAIFKAASLRRDAPQSGYWLTLDADGARLPSDWFLQIANEISRMFRGEIEPTLQLPLNPENFAEPVHK